MCFLDLEVHLYYFHRQHKVCDIGIWYLNIYHCLDGAEYENMNNMIRSPYVSGNRNSSLNKSYVTNVLRHTNEIPEAIGLEGGESEICIDNL